MRLWSPFTFDDGEHLGLFLEPLGDDQWVVTDHADTLMHASALGARLTKSRLDGIRNRFPGVELTEGGALRATAKQEELPNVVTAVLNTAIAISHSEDRWLPKSSEKRFNQIVGHELQAVAGERLKRNVMVQGISGHQLEFPFVIDLPTGGRQFIQPVASGDEHIDWGNVYKAGGKMLDLKSAGSDEDQRIVVVEDIPGDEELGKAITFLSVTTSVLLFSHRKQWLERFGRAA
ncbi:MAG: hypothetical protein A2040_06815 [Rhodocyclales bacterium GWA2_65_19]|nr:MAG: hypothetical protein A2040_06815 [Rhodocyclales bacterium GWA2_65_19]